ncbi:MAG: alkaline phosphatase family protein [Actinomycetota bacterium]|nr:alkaline phosphatase family protein [Actinomycetota bacterium]
MSKRVLVVAAVGVLVAVAGAYALRAPAGLPENLPTQDEMAADIGADIMTNLYRGHVPGRSGELMLVPRPHNFLIGEWDLTTLGTDEPTMSTSHPNPWNYLARVPIIVHGPRWAERGAVLDDEVDISNIAPTYAEVLGGVEGLEDVSAPLPGIQRSHGRCRDGRLPKPGSGPCVVFPKVIFTVVIDGGGWNALQQHADAWPFMDKLRDSSTTYTNAHIGSAPSITGALHATFGTGLYPIDHGIPGNQMRAPDGENTDTWLQNADPRYLDAPTVSELWDEQNANKPVVATVSYEGWHLGMIGHGAQRDGGDKDIAVLWEAHDLEADQAVSEWWINEEYYELPEYLQETDLETLETYEELLDPRDGLVDDTWYGHTLEQFQDPENGQLRPGTPAFVRFTGDAVIDVMRNENVGRDAVTDMFWVEMKMPDYAGHAWNVINAEQEDVIRETDRQIARMKAELDRTVGRGNYLFVISADHGQEPLPDVSGGWRINSKELQRDVEEQFGNIIEKVTPVDIYLDRDALEEADVDLAEVAGYIGAYTIGDNIPEGKPGEDRVPEGRLDELLFAGAFATEYLSSLSADKIEGFGDGTYPESDLYLPFDQDVTAP